jgi:tripartite-type tricarboxylate transporter receptor subunit TctC
MIIDSAAGSAIDASARIVAEGLSRKWGQPVVVVNQPGAGGSIAARAAAQTAPDGYTLYMPSFSAFVAEPGAASNLPLQVPRDFVPVGYLSGGPMFICAAPWLGVKTLPELIALAKKKPGELSYGTNGPGRLTHLTGELLQQKADIKLQMIPYSGGTSKVLTDIMGGRIPLIFEAYSGLAGAIKAGNLVPLAVASPQRVSDFPNLPTVAETLPGFEASGWQVLMFPAGTPDAIVQQANKDLNAMLAEPEVKTMIARLGRYERPMSAAEPLTFIHSEQQRWAPVQQRLSITR